MTNRHDFSQGTKRAVAARAGWHCSLEGCGKLTVGPSEEAPDAVTMLGKAAHITAASAGPGARRYDLNMSREQREDISNAIWLCADHADLIDRDEITYSTTQLHAMKRAHEMAIARAVRAGSSADLATGLLALGPNIICTGDLVGIEAGSWTLRLRHFLSGDMHTLVAFIDSFESVTPAGRYVLCNELGDGRVLAGAPSLTKGPEGYSLRCPIAPRFPRIDAQNIGSAMALHPETNDWYAENGHMACVSGLDFLPQMVRSILSMQQGESFYSPTSGMRFFEYFDAFQGSPWLDLLFKLDVIRQASIPCTGNGTVGEQTPLRCVTHVRSVELLAELPAENKLPVRVDLEVQGVGARVREFPIYMPTAEQMAERTQMLLREPPLNG